MSLLENSFLKLPLQNATQLYNDEVVPRLTKKNKVIAISAAVALSIIYFIRDRVTKPPRKLRHIPYLSYFGVLKSMYSKESVRDRSARVHIPEINSENSNGLFLVNIKINQQIPSTNIKVFFTGSSTKWMGVTCCKPRRCQARIFKAR